jgi:hypothetical protein
MRGPRRATLRRAIILALIVGGLSALMPAAPALAQHEPVIVVPGRPGVPVLFWGVDVSGAVIEGEFGLDRPGHVAPTVILPYWAPAYGPDYSSIYDPTPRSYYPTTGHKPRVGRLEVIPPANRRKPTPARPFYRQWGVESEPLPATVPPDYEPPPVIVAPTISNARPRPRPLHPPVPPAPPPPPPPKP